MQSTANEPKSPKAQATLGGWVRGRSPRLRANEKFEVIDGARLPEPLHAQQNHECECRASSLRDIERLMLRDLTRDASAVLEFGRVTVEQSEGMKNDETQQHEPENPGAPAGFTVAQTLERDPTYPAHRRWDFCGRIAAHKESAMQLESLPKNHSFCANCVSVDFLELIRIRYPPAVTFHLPAECPSASPQDRYLRCFRCDLSSLANTCNRYFIEQ
jgi:hypothetical protein